MYGAHRDLKNLLKKRENNKKTEKKKKKKKKRKKRRRKKRKKKGKRSEEHTPEPQPRGQLVCPLPPEKKKTKLKNKSPRLAPPPIIIA